MFRRSNDIVTDSFKLCRQRTTDATRSVCMRSIKATNAFDVSILGLVVCLFIATGCQPAGSERSDRSELSSGSERHAAGKAAASQPLGANVPPLGANVPPLGAKVPPLGEQMFRHSVSQCAATRCQCAAKRGYRAVADFARCRISHGSKRGHG